MIKYALKFIVFALMHLGVAVAFAQAGKVSKIDTIDFNSTSSTNVHHLKSAQGGVNGGGGDLAILDDRIVIADRYYQVGPLNENGRLFSLPQPILDELGIISKIMVSAGASVEKGEEFGVGNGYFHKRFGTSSKFVQEKILNTSLKYYFVDEIPNYDECGLRLSYKAVPALSELQQGACTIDNETWILE